MFSSADVQDRVTSIALVLCFKLKNHIIIYDICQFLYSFYKMLYINAIKYTSSKSKTSSLLSYNINLERNVILIGQS